jgi:Spy/CpxP family protein refolding chaperone
MNLFNNSGKRARIVGSVLLMIVFVAGALAGAASERVMRADEAPRTPRQAGEMRGGSRRLLQDEQFARELQLTTEQRAQIKAIMDRRDREAKRVWAEAEPRLKAVGDATRGEIQKVLTSAQVEKLEAEIAKRHTTWKDRHRCHAGDSLKMQMPRTQGNKGTQ